MKRAQRLRPCLLGIAVVALLLLATASPLQAGANVVLVNLDAGTGVGYDDPTPVAPEGGNPGTTLGQQRLIVAHVAADIWGSVLDSPVPIFVLSTFQSLPCAPNGAVAGTAGTTFVFANFPPGPPQVRPQTWYHSALADTVAGFDLAPGFADIISRFNININGDPGCLGGLRFYYGLDNQEGPNVDFLSVALHELAHGLGFGNFVNETTGANFLGLTDIYSVFTFDTSLGLAWSDLNDAGRASSAVNSGRVVWSGSEVTSRVSRFLDNLPILEALDPPLGRLAVQPASFGPPLTLEGVEGSVVLADDGMGVGTDACEPIVNRVRQAIALIDRGSCTFVTKVRHAEEAGAVAVIVANDQPGGPAPMGGSDPTIGIPSAGITRFEGQFIRSVLPDLVVRLGLAADVFFGTDDGGRMRLFAPAPAIPGSSISHWDLVALPNLLMEPAISSTIQSFATLDLTPFLLRDIGWDLADGDADGVADVEDTCAGSDISPRVTVGGCDSEVANTVLDNGCTIADEVAACAVDAGNHGDFVSCVAQRTNELRGAGILTGAAKGAIESCAAEAGE